MNHTPGPWRVGRQDIPIGYFPIYARTGITNISCVARTDAHEVGFGISEKEHRANARLIAAAPEQNEALKLARKFIANGIELGYITMPADDDPASKTLDIIDAALAKAEGKEEATG